MTWLGKIHNNYLQEIPLRIPDRHTDEISIWMALLYRKEGGGSLCRNFVKTEYRNNKYSPYKFLVTALREDDPVEFGLKCTVIDNSIGDMGSVSFINDRWYGIIVEIKADYIIIEKYNSGEEACSKIKYKDNFKLPECKEKDLIDLIEF